MDGSQRIPSWIDSVVPYWRANEESGFTKAILLSANGSKLHSPMSSRLQPVSQRIASCRGVCPPRTRYASRLCPLSRIVSGGRTLTASGWSPPGLGPLADYVRLDTSYLFNSRYCPGRHYPTPLTLSRRTLYASRYCPGGHYMLADILSRRTLSASRYCPGRHNLLADSVQADTIC